MVRGSAVVTVNRPCSAVFAAVTDVTRIGEWSPECVGARWLAPASGPAVGARFEGTNVVKLGPATLKKWTTISEVTHFKQDELFEFCAADFTTWRYEFIAIDDTTRVTETFVHAPYTGMQKLIYERLVKRTKSMVEGMETTLELMKTVIEQGS